MTSKFFACTYHLGSGSWRWPSKCPSGVVRMYGQLEKAPSTDSLHYQFIVITDSVCRFTGVQKLLGAGKQLHVEVMRKSLLANERYVGKEETKVETLPDLRQEPTEKLHPIDWLLTHHTMFNTKTYSRAVSLYYDPDFYSWFNSRSWLDVNADRLTEEQLAAY